MLGINLLSCLMLPMIVAKALRSVIRVCSWSWARTYFSLGVQSSHFQVGSYGTTGIATGSTAGGTSGNRNYPPITAAATSALIITEIFIEHKDGNTGMYALSSPYK